MYLSNLDQLYLFLIFTINGILIGIFFDCFRILRKTFKTSDFVTYIEDILFWIISGISVLITIFKFNNGELRLFIIIAILFGVVIYISSFSKYFISINVSLINLFSKILSKVIHILLFPLKSVLRFILKFFIKPISLVVINVNQIFISISQQMSKNILKFNKLPNKIKKTKEKKDFTN